MLHWVHCFDKHSDSFSAFVVFQLPFHPKLVVPGAILLLEWAIRNKLFVNMLTARTPITCLYITVHKTKKELWPVNKQKFRWVS